MIGRIAHSVLKLLPPEFAHTIGKKAMARRWSAPGTVYWGTPVQLLGRPIANPLGIAAGFDKNGELIDVFRDYGFGFMEVGSVTFRGGLGNKKPRLFRMPRRHLLNRMGLNGKPAAVVALKLRTSNERFLVNIAKTHDPQIMGDAAIRDVADSYNQLRSCGFGTVLNLSCPNTAEGRTFQDPAAASELLDAIRGIYWDTPKESQVPWGVKVGPDLKDGLEPLVQACEDAGCQFYVACNTAPFDHRKKGKGGLSGPGLVSDVLQTIKVIRDIVPEDREIIACGGVEDRSVARLYMAFGANAVEAFTGFVVGPNGGPRFAHTVLNGWDSLI